MTTFLSAVALLSLAVWVYLLLGRGFFWRLGEPAPALPPERWPSVAAAVPARDEAEVIGRAVASLLSQRYQGEFRVFVVDDHSRDGTADVARAAAASRGAADRLTIVAPPPLPAGWTGKLWAMSQGLKAVEAEGRSDLVLFTDADIGHDPDNLAGLVARLEAGRLDMASLMVKLRCESLAERFLIPAFVFFFAMLYPFAWSSDRRARTAAAAGGCILVRREALARIGGVERIRGELIDDCALAAAVKGQGGAIWLGLTQRTVSLRPYPEIGDVWRMVARTAYTQLRYSPVLLAGTVLGMIVTYLVPPLLTAAGLVFAIGSPATWAALAAWVLMTVSFMPILRFYGITFAWAPLLPAVAFIYLAATVDSARLHWRGKGGEWKGRVQQLRGRA
ncbi:MAG TPA: glycosyltransferase [Stellaceae bacterium]